ncbi:zinc finger A20 and AN1 domain-containing stress-associated protein 11-like [Panicum miliaceum]|uniref:Zinc finger A20 and AN1 domain-containing stress-associated protein 11-like n=1 Tax=Panicum miliaceum TaxID=4540 RepID=A0A3L6RN89_PANMI|nr:zinc finger A20 and AN1 domain-containing stress-associated protein 11-like [Panicum miliaceum]
MAQRDKKVEEPTELHAPELTLCANSCGFPGNPATKNLCQNCFLAASSASVSPPSPSPAVFDKPRPAAPPALWPPFAAPAADRASAGPAESPSKAPRTSSSVIGRGCCHHAVLENSTKKKKIMKEKEGEGADHGNHEGREAGKKEKRIESTVR